MIEQAQDFIPIWMLLSAAFGFLAGEAYGDQARHRKYLEQANADLRDQLQEAQPCEQTLQRALDQQRRVINDIHKRIAAVTKSLRKTRLVNPIKSTAGSLRSGRVKRCGFRYTVAASRRQ